MEQLNASDGVLRRAVGREGVDQTDAFEALEDPAQRGTVCRLFETV
jgi:hypothetical protein